MCISDAVFTLWTQGDFTRVGELLMQDIVQPFNPLYHACALAHHALMQTRLKRWDVAVEDAKKVVSVHPSSYVTLTIAC